MPTPGGFDCRNGKDPDMRYYDKLVRDGIPDLISRDGHTPSYEILSVERYPEYLQDKLEEELGEYRRTRNPVELMDIVEVIQAIVEHRGGTWEAFEASRGERRQERGGFSRRIWLRSVR